MEIICNRLYSFFSSEIGKHYAISRTLRDGTDIFHFKNKPLDRSDFFDRIFSLNKNFLNRPEIPFMKFDIATAKQASKKINMRISKRIKKRVATGNWRDKKSARKRSGAAPVAKWLRTHLPSVDLHGAVMTWSWTLLARCYEHDADGGRTNSTTTIGETGGMWIWKSSTFSSLKFTPKFSIFEIFKYQIFWPKNFPKRKIFLVCFW